jgi:hypothetical protein
VIFTEVQAPTAPPTQAVNLLASAERPEAGRWMDGIAFHSESCPEYQGFNPCAEQDELPETGSTGNHYILPVGYRVVNRCSTLQVRFEEDRARRQAEAIASFVVAEELWTGAFSKLEPFDAPGGTGLVNPHLASPDATSLTATSDVMTAVAELEYAAREASRGGPVFIHGPGRILGRVAQNFRRVGNELRTYTDAVVVPDAGYPGTGPNGAGEDWLYATGPVVARLGPVTVDPGPASQIDRRTNTRTVLADRMFAVTFDPCVHFAIQVTPPA